MHVNLHVRVQASLTQAAFTNRYTSVCVCVGDGGEPVSEKILNTELKIPGGLADVAQTPRTRCRPAGWEVNTSGSWDAC